MIPDVSFSDLVWTRPPAEPSLSDVWVPHVTRTFWVGFVSRDFEPGPEVGGYAVITNPDVVRVVRRRLRRERRQLVKIYGHAPNVYQDRPFWWTPRTPKLVVLELLAPHAARSR